MSKLIIDPKDNVAVCLTGVDAIPTGHKVALRDIAPGEAIVKYGQVIGRATQSISKGQWVHTHNICSHLDEEAQYTYRFDCPPVAVQPRTFMGFPRNGRRAGIRNEIYIIPTVGCVNNVCQRLAAEAQALIYGTIDGIYALTHPFGCSQLGQDQENLRQLLRSVSLNPNASFALFVGLGCENNQLTDIREALRAMPSSHIAFLNCQDVEDEHAAGMAILRAFAEAAGSLQRVPVDYSELCIGLKCGGSDAFSGLTANPLVGRVTDLVVAAGGSAVLTEVPEMFGAEQLLMNKCISAEVFEKYKNMVEAFKQHYRDQGFPVYENPSPGNKAGGISTLEEKSVGCVQKAGTTPIVDVLDYGQTVTKTGVSVLNAPGNDLIAATALAAAGCQVVLFTTGRGTPFSTFVPTMKISSNTPLAAKKAGWIDFDAYTMDTEGLFALLEQTVNGQYRCKSEAYREIAFYKTGVTL